MKEQATRRNRTYPTDCPKWFLDEIRSENELLGIPGPTQIGKTSAELRGQAARNAAYYEQQLRNETVPQRIKRLGAAIKQRRQHH